MRTTLSEFMRFIVRSLPICSPLTLIHLAAAQNQSRLFLLRHNLILDLVIGPLLDGQGFAFKARDVHSIFSAESSSRRCQRYSTKSSRDSPSNADVSTPYSSPCTHRTIPAAT